MKPTTHITPQFAENISLPLEVPVTSNNARRPARRGNFWPGESFGTCTRKWDLTGVFADNAFVLPALIGGNGSRSL